MQPQSIPTRTELTGLEAIAINKADKKTRIELHGMIVDETKNTILIETKGTTKKLLKKDWEIIVTINGEKIIINGEKIQKRPEERIKLTR